VAVRYVLDTNLFIDAFRNPAENEALQRFHAAFGPFELFSAVVGHELRAGVLSVEDRRQLDRHVLAPFARRGRIVVPTYRTWMRAAEALPVLAKVQGLRIPQCSRAFANDILLAASCREVGATLVTRNDRDFRRIQKVMSFRFVPPWPALSGRGAGSR
jgi:predicted nucleic acid-binding protein